MSDDPRRISSANSQPSSFDVRVCSLLQNSEFWEAYTVEGRVSAVRGLNVDVDGATMHLTAYQQVQITRRTGRSVFAEVVGFRDGQAQTMIRGSHDDLGPGDLVQVSSTAPTAGLTVSRKWKGRVVDPFGNQLDGAGRLDPGPKRPLRAIPPVATSRARLGKPLDLGVAALNAFAPCREGQRLGLFAGSGVGKSTLVGMLARYGDCDTIVVALVGERGREVREFIEEELGSDGLKKSVVVVATSDTAPLCRRDAAYAAMAIAEYFRDQGDSVLLLLDSLTRFCFALREIGLSAGEPPGPKGYPATVFPELARLLERAGPGVEGAGRITAVFSVLVEGDDFDEPVADAVRGFLDGHIILDRRIGDAGRYPAIDVIRSLSRSSGSCLSDLDAEMANRARRILGRYSELVDLVRMGLFKPGIHSADDEAIAVAPRIHAVLHQNRTKHVTTASTFSDLRKAVFGDTIHD